MLFDGRETRRCPRRVLHPDEGNTSGLADLFWYYGRYKCGFLPEHGGLNDQCAKLMQMFRVIDEANAACDAKEHEERTRQARAQSVQRGAKGRRSRPA
ncbi:hypothetical protein AQY21_20730 [Paracoccus sp. MKU1]|nr:hypothetical protein AQY21_20730 [Paracoccus sp. MKU1]